MHANPSVSTLSGKLISFNLSPKGVPEGMIIQQIDAAAGDVVQINFSPELAGQVTRIVQPGDAITAETVPFHEAEDDAHPVYDLVRLTTSDGNTLTAEGAPEMGVRVQGVVVRINYARRGEPNGAILDTGDFVHLRPHGARAIALSLGQSITAEGDVRSGWSGHRVLEARVANGIVIEKPGHPKKHHKKPHRPGHHGPHEHHPHGRRHGHKHMKHVKPHHLREA
ncbi:MAG: hypothetical protein ACTHM6_18660 [Tepidisphaeraceae bacterium]